MTAERWVSLFTVDPRPALLAAAEPYTRLFTLVELYGKSQDEPEVTAARQAVLADGGVQELLSRLPDWEAYNKIGGHNSPGYAPNLLNLLADMGLQGGDDPRLERILDQMLAHQESDGHFTAFGGAGRGAEPAWGSLLCDTHVIVEVLIRFGRLADPRTQAGIRRIGADIAQTEQGPAWLCLPHSSTGFRGPGRKVDLCPQVTLEALRTLARVPPELQPSELLQTARTALVPWRRRGEQKPYMFGHGKQFKTVKWPPFWYDIHMTLDALGRYPGLWRGEAAAPADRRALVELVACLVTYNCAPNGTVTPHSCYQGFSQFSFGQKKTVSPFATALLLAVLRRFDDLIEEARQVDVRELSSSKGGSGKAVPPR